MFSVVSSFFSVRVCVWFVFCKNVCVSGYVSLHARVCVSACSCLCLCVDMHIRMWITESSIHSAVARLSNLPFTKSSYN